MNTRRKGASPLAILIDSLPVRGRIGVVLLMGNLTLQQLKSSPDFPVARAAFDLDRRWYDGERFDPDLFEEAHHDECDRGVSPAAMEARSPSEFAAWAVLASANLYIAFQAYREMGSLPSPVVSEVQEDEQDEIYRYMQTISPAFMDMARRAADFFREGGEASFDELKTILSRR